MKIPNGKSFVWLCARVYVYVCVCAWFNIMKRLQKKKRNTKWNNKKTTDRKQRIRNGTKWNRILNTKFVLCLTHFSFGANIILLRLTFFFFLVLWFALFVHVHVWNDGLTHRNCAMRMRKLQQKKKKAPAHSSNETIVTYIKACENCFTVDVTQLAAFAIAFTFSLPFSMSVESLNFFFIFFLLLLRVSVCIYH